MVNMLARGSSMQVQGAGFLIATFVTIAVALMAKSQGAVAQNASQQGELGEIKHEKVGYDSHYGAPLEQLRLSRPVSYKDLDLSTQAGQDELKKRIRQVAQQSCQELSRTDAMNPTLSDASTCVRQAVSSAAPQMRIAVASAESGRVRRE